MEILVTIVHVIACIILVLVVLLQAGKGADMGAVFGGASSTIFGSSGAGNFLTRLTTGAAVVFMTTSLALTWVGTRGGGSTIMPESGIPRCGIEQPAADAGAPADEAPGAVADGAAAPAGDAAAPGGEAVAPAGEGAAPAADPAPAAAPEAAPAPAAP
jgi:preprotein translocase subunit SecG